MLDIKNAKQINVIWTDSARKTVIPCRNWTIEEKKRTVAKYSRYAECLHAYLS